jgi:hypothetical protein
MFARTLLFAALSLAMSGRPTLADDAPRPLVQVPLADGITLTATGQATKFDRFVLVIVPAQTTQFVQGNTVNNHEAGQKAIRTAMARFELKETTIPYAGASAGYYTMPFGVAYELGGTTKETALGKLKTAEILDALERAGATPEAYLVSRYSTERAAVARRDALADAIQSGRAQAQEIAQVVGQKAGKLLAARIDSIEGTFVPGSARQLTRKGLGSGIGGNYLTLTLRFAIE